MSTLNFLLYFSSSYNKVVWNGSVCVCLYELFIYFYWQMSNGAFSFLFFFFVKMKFFCIFINFCYFDIIFKQTFFTHSFIFPSIHSTIEPSFAHISFNTIYIPWLSNRKFPFVYIFIYFFLVFWFILFSNLIEVELLLRYYFRFKIIIKKTLFSFICLCFD